MRRARLLSGLVMLTALVWAFSPDGFAQRPPPGSPVGNRQVATNTPALGGIVRDATTGAPLAGAVASLGRNATGVGAILSASAGRQVTDYAGRFLFTNLEILTTYSLTATRPGYFDGGYGITPSGGALQPIRLTGDQAMTDLEIPLLKPGALSGRVTDETGNPLIGVRVVALSREVVSGTLRWVTGPGATTDDRGLYRIAPLLPGEYVVMVPAVRMTVPAEAPIADRMRPTLDQLALGGVARSSLVPRPEARILGEWHLIGEDLAPARTLPPGQARQGSVTTFFPGADSPATAAAIPLSAGEERAGLNIQVRSEPLFTVSGSVSPGQGSVTLRLVPRGAEALGLGHEVAFARSGPDGRFAFLDVPARDYVILAGGSIGGYVFPFPGTLAYGMSRGVEAAPGTLIHSLRGDAALGMRASMPTAEPYLGLARVSVTRDTDGVTVPLSRGVALRGRLVQEASTTGSTSARPSLVEYRRTIVAEPAGGEPWLGLPKAVAVPDGSGLAFTIEDVLPGEYVLRPQVGTLESIVWRGQDYTERPLPVAAGADLSGIVIRTTRVSARLHGIVRDAEDRSVRATVICFPAERAVWQRHGIASPRLTMLQTSENAAGESYFLQPMPAGEYYVLAIAQPLPRLWLDAAFLERAATVATRVALTTGETPPVDLRVVELPR